MVKSILSVKRLTLPTSTRLVTMTMQADCSCHTILQKSYTVSCTGPVNSQHFATLTIEFMRKLFVSTSGGTEFLTLCSNVVTWPLVALKAQHREAND